MNCDVAHRLSAYQILARNGEQRLRLLLGSRCIQAGTHAPGCKFLHAFALADGFFRDIAQRPGARKRDIGLRYTSSEKKPRGLFVQSRRLSRGARAIDLVTLLAEKIERIRQIGLQRSDPARGPAIGRRYDVILAQPLAHDIAVERCLRKRRCRS